MAFSWIGQCYLVYTKGELLGLEISHYTITKDSNNFQRTYFNKVQRVSKHEKHQMVKGDIFKKITILIKLMMAFKMLFKLVIVAYTYNPSYLGSWCRSIISSSPRVNWLSVL